MTDAYQCDFCGEFNTNRPVQTLYKKDHDRGQNETYVEAYHLCKSCHKEINTEDDGENGEVA